VTCLHPFALYSFPPVRVMLLRRTAPKTLKYRQKWIRYFAIIKHRPVTLQGKAHRAFLPLPGARLVYVSEDSRLDPAVENGDRPFCAQVMSALKVAKIPPAPDEKTYQTFSC
jgi:hypothetical protein